MITTMRPNTPTTAGATLAAVAAGLLVLRQMNRRRDREVVLAYDDGDDSRPHRSLGGTLFRLAALVGGGIYLSNQLRRSAGSSSRGSVEESIELAVPVSTAYNQWTQFEEFPRFMATVEQVTQVDDTHLHWRAVVAGKVKEWDAEITEQVPDQRIAWRSTGGVRNAGVVTFHRIGENRTRVMLQMDYEPDSAVEKAADVAGAVKLTTKGNLQRFKELVESRGSETGAWRGTVPAH